MVPTSFDEANCVFDKPEDMDREACGPLNVYIDEGDENGTPFTISCWKLTKAEIKELMKTGRIWVYHMGPGLQPHTLSCHNPFKRH